MRTLMTLIIALLVSMVPVFAQSAADEAAIREATKQYQDTYNKRDIGAISALIDENFQSWAGDRKTRADWMKFMEQRFERQKAHQREPFEEAGIDFITPDIAIHKYYEEWTDWMVDGETVPPFKTFHGCLYVKKNGKWLRRANFFRSERE